MTARRMRSTACGDTFPLLNRFRSHFIHVYENSKPNHVAGTRLHLLTLRYAFLISISRHHNEFINNILYSYDTLGLRMATVLAFIGGSSNLKIQITFFVSHLYFHTSICSSELNFLKCIVTIRHYTFQEV